MLENRDLAHVFKALDMWALLEVALIIGVTAGLIIASQKVLPWIGNRLHGQYRFYVLASIPLLRLLIIAVAFVLIVPILIEPSVQNMVAVLGAASLAVGFALKDYVSSLIAGVVSVFEMPYRPGDWIEVDGIYGEVKHVGMRTVKIVTADDTMVNIPHLKLWNQPIYNANNGGVSLQCVAHFYLHPDHDAGQVSQLLQDVAMTSPYLQFDKPVAVIAHERPWGTHYRLRAYPVDPRQQFRFLSDLTVRGKRALQGLGIRWSEAPVSVNEKSI
jgi:small conductance mechanosensitive channel